MTGLPRRYVLGGLFAIPAAGAAQPNVMAVVTQFTRAAKAIKDTHGGRIGLSAVWRGDGQEPALSSLNYTLSPSEFAMCSTFKWVLAAAILKGVDEGKLSLSQKVPYGEKDLLEYAPGTRARLSEGAMSVGDMCAATVSLSDNPAANLLLPLVGGPAGLTTFVRGLGDKITRFDRTEPELNSNIDGDPRDTTTPKAMTDLLIKLFETPVLKPESRAALSGWMKATSTGNDRIRAGVPAGWVVGDKTGTGNNGSVNDVGFIITPSGARIYLSIYTSGGKLDIAGNNKVIADLTRLVVATLA